MYGYLFGTTAVMGLDVLGESQLIGYPSIPFTRGAPYNGAWTAPPQFPSVSLLSWGGAFGNPGDGTARYWALKLLNDEMRSGPPSGPYAAADADVLVTTTVSGGASPTPSVWTDAIETALGRTGSLAARQAAADSALAIATQAGWQDSRAAFSHFAVGRLWAGSAPEVSLMAFDRAAAIYARLPGGALQVAHIDMQLAAMALASGQVTEAVQFADRAIPVVTRYENAALLATLMLIKAEALERMGDAQAAAALRLDSQVWARYGFGPDSVVKARMRDIAAVADRGSNG